METKNLFSAKAHSNDRTFFFDIRESAKKRPYLVITESKKVDENNFERKAMVIFERDLFKFSSAFMQTLLHFHPTDRETIIEEARRKYPNAFEPWTEELDEELKTWYEEGREVGEIARNFGRNMGAIFARLKKLGLVEQSS